MVSLMSGVGVGIDFRSSVGTSSFDHLRRHALRFQFAEQGVALNLPPMAVSASHACHLAVNATWPLMNGRWPRDAALLLNTNHSGLIDIRQLSEPSQLRLG